MSVLLVTLRPAQEMTKQPRCEVKRRDTMLYRYRRHTITGGTAFGGVEQ